ncbi:SWET1 protein, partial [Amia calva]|nr:SWET1 protein [Amia calva]
TDLRRMVSSGSAENVQFLPFLTTCLNNLGWLYYGTLKRDGTLVIVNSIGAVLQAVYISAFCLYTQHRRRVLMQTALAAAGLCVGVLYFTQLLSDPDTRLSQLGLTCSLFTISMYLSPLTDLVQIVRSRSVKCLSYSLTVATFLTSTSWTLYGLQLQDLYIMVPNTPGIVTSLIRFWLFWRFTPSSPEKFSYRPLQA